MDFVFDFVFVFLFVYVFVFVFVSVSVFVFVVERIMSWLGSAAKGWVDKCCWVGIWQRPPIRSATMEDQIR